MEILVNQQGQFVLKRVYEPIILRTEEGNGLSVAMRDDTFEMKVLGDNPKDSSETYRADITTGTIHRLTDSIDCSANVTMRNGKLLNVSVGDRGIDIKSPGLGTIRLSHDFKEITQLQPTEDKSDYAEINL